MSVLAGPSAAPAYSFLDFDPVPPRRTPLARSASLLVLPTFERAPEHYYSQPPKPAAEHPLYTLPRRAASPAPALRTPRVAAAGRSPAQEPLAPAWTPSFARATPTMPPPVPCKPKAARSTPSRFLAPRERYPKARRAPNLYRTALLRRMHGTPEGRALLHMGAHLAVSMLEATRALEGLVAAQDAQDADDEDDEDDEGESDSPAWVNVPLGPTPDDAWEIVDDPATTVPPA